MDKPVGMYVCCGSSSCIVSERMFTLHAQGATLLHHASTSAVVKKLLAGNADPGVTESRVRPPLCATSRPRPMSMSPRPPPPRPLPFPFVFPGGATILHSHRIICVLTRSRPRCHSARSPHRPWSGDPGGWHPHPRTAGSPCPTCFCVAEVIGAHVWAGTRGLHSIAPRWLARATLLSLVH